MSRFFASIIMTQNKNKTLTLEFLFLGQNIHYIMQISFLVG